MWHKVAGEKENVGNDRMGEKCGKSDVCLRDVCKLEMLVSYAHMCLTS